MEEIKDNPLEVEANSIRDSIKRNGALVYKNVIKLDVINDFMEDFVSFSETLKDAPSKSREREPISGYRKFNIGSFGEFGEFPRFFRTTYLPFWLPSLEFSEQIFKPILRLRNHLAGLPDDYVNGIDQRRGLWSACRVQQYFVGGGFFSEHKDIVIKKISQDIEIETIQLVLLLSSKGIDFDEGGAFIRTEVGGLIDLESAAKSGDIIAYDGSSSHGVAPIDPHKTLKIDLSSGRFAALASVYKILK